MKTVASASRKLRTKMMTLMFVRNFLEALATVFKDPLNPHGRALAFVLGVLDGVVGDIEQRRVHSRQDGGDDQTQGRTEEIGEHAQTSVGVGMSVRPL